MRLRPHVSVLNATRRRKQRERNHRAPRPVAVEDWPGGGWHVWTKHEVDHFTRLWGVDRTVAETCLNFQQEESAAGRRVSMVSLGELAQRIDKWGQKRQADGEAIGIADVQRDKGR